MDDRVGVAHSSPVHGPHYRVQYVERLGYSHLPQSYSVYRLGLVRVQRDPPYSLTPAHVSPLSPFLPAPLHGEALSQFQRPAPLHGRLTRVRCLSTSARDTQQACINALWQRQDAARRQSAPCERMRAPTLLEHAV